ncbi:hypothetical protein A7K94_0217580 [Modestobacter sp. VKM Ac-2676]|nr:hypothetical protein A7K94_0217580 [Modestobacter sp. VKM Ac-2676]
MVLAPDGTATVEVGTAEFGNGTATVHTQLVADALGLAPDRVRLVASDTATSGYDSGAFGSTGSVSPARRCSTPPRRCAAGWTPRAVWTSWTGRCRRRA